MQMRDSITFTDRFNRIFTGYKNGTYHMNELISFLNAVSYFDNADEALPYAGEIALAFGEVWTYAAFTRDIGLIEKLCSCLTSENDDFEVMYAKGLCAICGQYVKDRHRAIWFNTCYGNCCASYHHVGCIFDRFHLQNKYSYEDGPFGFTAWLLCKGECKSPFIPLPNRSMFRRMLAKSLPNHDTIDYVKRWYDHKNCDNYIKLQVFMNFLVTMYDTGERILGPVMREYVKDCEELIIMIPRWEKVFLNVVSRTECCLISGLKLKYLL